MTPKSPKKTDTLEVRLPPETKEAFMRRCREEHHSASDVVRGFIDSYLAARPITPERSMQKSFVRPRLLQATLAGVVTAIGLVFVFAAPSNATPDWRQAFARLDANGDGAVSAAEFAAAQAPDQYIAMEAQTVSTGAPRAAVPIPGAASAMSAGVRVRDLPPGAPQARLEDLQLSPIDPAFAPTLAAQQFNEIDADGSGEIRFSEFAAAKEAQLRAAFTALDANGDGRLARAELEAAPSPDNSTGQFMTRSDINHDGALSFEEFAS